jgi:non-ribosomal peptide synthetase component E (peptide arylation enzyme)
LHLELRLEQGELRFYRLDTGEKLLSHAEAQRKADRLAAKLRELGIDPDLV